MNHLSPLLDLASNKGCYKVTTSKAGDESNERWPLRKVSSPFEEKDQSVRLGALLVVNIWSTSGNCL